MCTCILERQSVAYHPWVSVTLTSDLVSRIGIEPDAYLLYSLRKEFQIWCVNASWDGGVSRLILGSLRPLPLTYFLDSASILVHLGMTEYTIPFWVNVTLTLTFNLVFRIIVTRAYLLYYVR